ncbi:MAG: glycosyl hydrolase family 65 protein [bacterium]|nr:glycosyl hydrolase family 65 protein [bacterium]
MAKIAEKYLKVDPWLVVEEGFHPDRSRVSESIFSLANELMGVRGYFDEGYSGDRLVGSYVNGIFDEKEIIHAAYFLGMAKRFCFMINTVDWLYTRIFIDGEQLDLNTSEFSDFIRTLDMKKGIMTREFVWTTNTEKKLRLIFTRMLSMNNANMGFQKVEFIPLNFDGSVEIESGVDFNTIHELENKNFFNEVKRTDDGQYAILCKTLNSHQQLFSSFQIDADAKLQPISREKFVGVKFSLPLKSGETNSFVKTVVNYADREKDTDSDLVWKTATKLADKLFKISFADEYSKHIKFWTNSWDRLDITVEGDDENQQGVRFCIFNLVQTYHGNDPTLNVGAKGLTGEYYYGWTWWDTETYCLPFYMFSNPQAAKSLLEYRYNTMPQAIERAKEMQCDGTCYPMGTIDGTESCGTWQHGNLEIHVTAAIPYGIWHYNRICKDKDFLYNKGFEMLLQASRYFASRGAWGSQTGKYGYFGVMGPDEFHMMVNNNCYTNFMAKKCFDFTLEVFDEIKTADFKKFNEVISRLNITDAEISDWKKKSENMYISFDQDSLLFEQHDGYYNLPYLDVKAIPHTQFPVYNNWEYGKIFRTSMTKQPDVLLFLFFYSQQFSKDILRANYDYYEPRCSHESSLSPSIHSILACDLGKVDQALEFSQYASRLDLDDYNRNANQGLHITSMAATWMNFVYGFGGMRSDGELLVFNPVLPQTWKSYSFKITYLGNILQVSVKNNSAFFRVLDGDMIKIKVFNNLYCVDKNGVTVSF